MIHGKIGGLEIGDSKPVLVMGVVNLTKNSFYGGSVRTGTSEIASIAESMKKEGASIIDVGARSTAPYRKYDIPEHTESKLLAEAIRLISSKVSLPISADTTRYLPAKAALEEGASILNDVYGLTQKDSNKLARLAASKECSLLLAAHESRVHRPHDPIVRIKDCLEKSIELAESEGVERDQITIDPGIGFFSDPNLSNVEWNCNAIARLEELRTFERPICVGVSRKRFIGSLTGDKPTDLRLHGSLAATAISVYNGAHVIRTHDVSATLEAVRVAEGTRKNSLIHQTAGQSRRDSK